MPKRLFRPLRAGAARAEGTTDPPAAHRTTGASSSGAGPRRRVPPTTVEVLPTGEAIACYDGTPLLKYDSLEELLSSFSLSAEELEELTGTPPGPLEGD